MDNTETVEKRIFDKTNVLVILLLSLITSFLVNIRMLLEFISGKGAAETQELFQKISDILHAPFVWLDEHLLTTTATTVIFWAVIGLVSSTIIFFFSDIRNDAKRAVVEGNDFVHPDSFDKTTYRKSIYLNFGLLLAVMCGYIITAISTFRVFIPLSSDTLFTLLYSDDSSWLSKILNGLLSYLSILLVFVLVVFIRKIYLHLRLRLNT